ncbi:hypothetical protein [Auraticoccus monumenti]|uniref:hypothetical protein n=1 Tax=Auraticoccus monumenti TaxID=675864 RepID=UPI0012F70ED8|nr:hypothetical protein [Auraticoccus monumenti]
MNDNDKAKNEKPGFLRHPVTVLIIGAIAGFTSGFATNYLSSSLSSDITVSQYWRDKRLAVYSDFYASVQDAETLHTTIRNRVRFATVYEVDEIDLKELDTLSIQVGELNDVLEDRASFAALISDESVSRSVNRVTQESHDIETELTQLLLHLHIINGEGENLKENHLNDFEQELSEFNDSKVEVHRQLREALGIK